MQKRKKKRMAHRGAAGIVASASGYTTNASPGPEHDRRYKRKTTVINVNNI